MYESQLSEDLKSRADTHENMTFLVRQLQHRAEILPIEIYFFTKDTRWANYEGIQADIFDHILAIIPEFGLRYYQKPSVGNLSSFLRSPIQKTDP